MKTKKIKNQPIPKLLAFFPEGENFEDTRNDYVGGAWISNEAWRNIHDRLRTSNDQEVVEIIKQIKKENFENYSFEEREKISEDERLEGVFLTDYQFAILETKISSLEQNTESIKLTNSKTPDETLKQSDESTKFPAKEKSNTPKETWEQRNQTALMRLIHRKAEEKRKSEVKKNW